MKSLATDKIKQLIRKSGYAVPAGFSISEPPKMEMGDFATNTALIIAAKKKTNPLEIAEKLKKRLQKDGDISKVSVAGSGFLNFSFKNSIYKKELVKILREKGEYGRDKARGKISVEYISANPTGPIHIGNARGGPIGEAIANLYQFLGHKVTREFYINDVGGQIDRFAESLYFWYYKKFDSKAEFPEEGYPGDYIKELSGQIQKECFEKLKELGEKEDVIALFKKEGLYHMVKTIREDAELIGIKFDRWVNQSDFQYSGKTEKVIARLEKRGATVKKEGALWFRNPTDPNLLDKESVLRKSDETGSFTYFADDIAYHLDKYERGYKIMVDVWGANHSGHVARIKSAIKSMGQDSDKLKIILYQYVRLKNAGKVMSMSKRQGSFATLRQIIKMGVHPDAFKYFILSQNPNTPFDFDLKLASDASEKNPVFYIKYAHARICSILKKVKGGGLPDLRFDFSLLSDPKEVALYKTVVLFPDLINEAKDNLQIQTLPHFAYKVAGLFHEFYAACPVLTKDKKLSQARLALILAVKYVLANVLQICDIEAPERM